MKKSVIAVVVLMFLIVELAAADEALSGGPAYLGGGNVDTFTGYNTGAVYVGRSPQSLGNSPGYPYVFPYHDDNVHSGSRQICRKATVKKRKTEKCICKAK